MHIRLARNEFKEEQTTEEVYEINGARVLLTQKRETPKRTNLWLDLSQSGYVLSEAGYQAAENLIEEYARRGIGYRRLANSKQIQTQGDSIIVLCYKSDIPDFTQRLLDIVSNSANLDKTR